MVVMMVMGMIIIADSVGHEQGSFSRTRFSQLQLHNYLVLQSMPNYSYLMGRWSQEASF